MEKEHLQLGRGSEFLFNKFMLQPCRGDGATAEEICISERDESCQIATLTEAEKVEGQI